MKGNEKPEFRNPHSFMEVIMSIFPKWMDVEEVEEEVIVDEQGRWLVSTLNRLNAVTQSRELPQKVIIKDDTLRSGANTPGVYASTEKKLQLAKMLEAIGVKEVEGGYPGIDEHIQFMRTLKERGTELRIGAHTPLWHDDFKEEIDRAVDCGVDVINLYVFNGPLLVRAVHEDLRREKVMERIAEGIAYSRQRGAFTAFGTDFYRFNMIERLCRLALDSGAQRIFLYDAKGCLTPEAVSFLVRYVRDIIGPDIEIGMHCHDDYGLATVNTLEAVKATADVVDVTVNRTGHRCGNASFEQVVTALETLYGISTGVDLSKISELCVMVADLYGLSIPPNAPIVGKNMYTYGGFHITGILRGEWYLWENVKADALGCRREIFYGPTALQRGKDRPIDLKIRQMGLEATPDELDRVFDLISEVLKQKTQATEEEVEAIIRKVLASS